MFKGYKLAARQDFFLYIKISKLLAAPFVCIALWQEPIAIIK